MDVKLDMAKAYDRLDWDFTRKCFFNFGFHDKWIIWIMQCISTTSFNVIVTGNCTHLILLERGIR